MSHEPGVTPDDTTAIPDERPQRRREYSGAGSTLGLAALIIVAVGVAIWWFELRGETASTAGDDGFGVIALPGALNTTGKSPVPELGRAAPNFQLASLDGPPRTLTDFRGKYVLLNFWASWCEPCRSESPDLQRLADRQPDRLVVFGVNQEEPPEAASAFARDFGITYPLALDRQGEVAQAYRLPGLPVTFLIDPDGVIVRAFPGRVSAQQLDDLEREFLAP